MYLGGGEELEAHLVEPPELREHVVVVLGRHRAEDGALGQLEARREQRLDVS